jgi:hypothetical protein
MDEEMVVAVARHCAQLPAAVFGARRVLEAPA